MNIEEGSDYKDSRPLPEILEKLTERLRCGKATACLNKPASNEELASLEVFLDIQMPAQLKELYLLTNGQDTKPLYVPLFLNGHVLNSVDDIKKYHKEIMKWCEKKSIFSEVFDDGSVWLYSKLIPIADSIIGGLLCVDMNNSSGYIIEFEYVNYNGKKLALSVKDYLGYIENSLQTRKFFVHYEYLMRMPHESL